MSNQETKLKKLEVPFTQVPNAVLHGSGLSLKAMGLYAYLQSKPDGWEFSSVRIARDVRDGERAVKTALIELEESGYLERRRQGDGRMIYKLSLCAKTAQSQNSTMLKQHNAKTAQIIKKDNIQRKNNTKKDIILHSEQSSQVNDLLSLFKEINPSLNFGNKTQRKALEWLIDKTGFQKARSTVEYAVSIQGQKYAPTITTPYELQKKLGQVLVFYKKNNSSTIRSL